MGELYVAVSAWRTGHVRKTMRNAMNRRRSQEPQQTYRVHGLTAARFGARTVRQREDGMETRQSSRVAGGLLAAITVIAATACTDKPSPTRSQSAAPHAGPSAGCGGTALQSEDAPPWVTGPPKGLRYAEDPNGVVAAFLFGDPLRAGSPTNPSNKILWALRPSLAGSEVTLTLLPVSPQSRSPSRGPIVQQLWPAASPSWAYPSIVDVPVAGCWRFSLHWAHGDAVLYLPYV